MICEKKRGTRVFRGRRIFNRLMKHYRKSLTGARAKKPMNYASVQWKTPC